MTKTVALKNLIAESQSHAKDFKGGQENSFVAQVFVFEGEEYIGWDCFNKSKVTVGKSKSADLVLSGSDISDRHAVFYVKHDQIIVSDKESSIVQVNGKRVETCILGPLDVVDIGPYTLKIRLKRIVDKNHEQNITSEKPLAGENLVYKPVYKDTEISGKGLPESDVVEQEEEANYFVEEIDQQEVIDEREDVLIEAEPAYETWDNELESLPEKNVIENIEEQEEINVATVAEETKIEDDVQIETESASEEQRVIYNYKDSHTQLPEKQSATPIDEESSDVDSVDEEPVDGNLSYEDPSDENSSNGSTESDITQIKIEKPTNDIEQEVIQEITTDCEAKRNITDVDNDQPDSSNSNQSSTEDSVITNEIEFKDVVIYMEDDEEEDDDDDVDLFLQETLTESQSGDAQAIGGNIADNYIEIEIVKYRAGNVVDVSFLSNRKKYHIFDENKRFCLAENKNGENCYFYFNDRLKGLVHNGSDRHIDTGELCTEENLHNKKDNLYRDRLPKNGEVILSDGYHEYLLRRVLRSESPKISEPKKSKNYFTKNLLKSCGVHVICLLFLSIFISLPKAPTPTPPESRFVRLDTKHLSQNEMPLKKKTPPIQKESSAVSAKKEKSPKKRIKVRQKRAVSKSKKKKSRGSSMLARSPKAGGGSSKGNGNVSNRNVKEVGLLGALGIENGIGLMPSKAIAAVTNLDAVTSVSANKGNFKIGGIVGSLGNSKIAASSGPVVTTKGSNQVLRSAGIKGKGTVAALAKGKTGQNQVMAVVSAKLNKKVRIQGGMSREAVKKVIDQHLDEISFCYESALVANPSLLGKVVFEWKILTSGKVGEVKIKTSSINSSEIHSCIKQGIKSWRFPKPKGAEVVVSYPFVFDLVGF